MRKQRFVIKMVFLTCGVNKMIIISKGAGEKLSF